MALGVSCLSLHIQAEERELPFATHLKRCTHSLTKISKDTLLQTFYILYMVFLDVIEQMKIFIKTFLV